METKFVTAEEVIALLEKAAAAFSELSRVDEANAARDMIQRIRREAEEDAA